MLLETESGASRCERNGLRLAQRVQGAHLAQVFPFGEGSALLWRGHLEQLTGSPRRARASWEAARTAADRLGMLHERAQADLALGRFARDASERRVHLRRALDTFLALEVAPDVARAQAELARP